MNTLQSESDRIFPNIFKVSSFFRAKDVSCSFSSKRNSKSKLPIEGEKVKTVASPFLSRFSEMNLVVL